MSNDECVWFPTKIDWWIGLAMCIPPVSSTIVIVNALRNHEAGAFRVGLISAAVVLLIYGGLVFPIRYGISKKELVVRFGLFRSRIDLTKIQKVEPSLNPLSAPALSLSRLDVKTGEGFFESTLVSPADRDGFLKLLSERTGLLREGDVLAASASKTL